MHARQYRQYRQDRRDRRIAGKLGGRAAAVFVRATTVALVIAALDDSAHSSLARLRRWDPTVGSARSTEISSREIDLARRVWGPEPPPRAIVPVSLFVDRAAAPRLAELRRDEPSDDASNRGRWVATFEAPIHLGLVRALFGRGPLDGVPTRFRWEARAPVAGACPSGDDAAATPFVPLDGASDESEGAAQALGPRPQRRSWFVDADVCALALVVDATNGGAPAIGAIRLHSSARNVLRDATARELRGEPSSRTPVTAHVAGGETERAQARNAAAAIDGTYARGWTGAAGARRWTLRIDLATPTRLDRVRLVIGDDATSRSRGLGRAGRSYAIASAPLRYVLEATEDGVRWTTLATTPTRRDGTILPLRRRMVDVAGTRPLRALRLSMDGATDADGRADPQAAPVLREISAYSTDDLRPILLPPWVLSINANPSAQTHLQPGGEIANDRYYAKFLQERFSAVVPTLLRDDRFARSLGPRGELLSTGRRPNDGEALESIEGDDSQLDERLLGESSPPPIAVLSGSNDWDYSARTRADLAAGHVRWLWDPLLPPSAGGVGQLAGAVKGRVAPLLGFCGGAQLLALLEAAPAHGSATGLDSATLDAIVRRTTGRSVRARPTTAMASGFERSWPGEDGPRAAITFDPNDPLFRDLAGSSRRARSLAFPESHSDAVRPDAFLPGHPLASLERLASSEYCGEQVVDGGPLDRASPNTGGPGKCLTIPEVFRSREGRFPLVGVQAHAERPVEFLTAAAGDPPESIADPLVFIGAAYEQIVDAYLRDATHAEPTPRSRVTLARTKGRRAPG